MQCLFFEPPQYLIFSQEVASLLYYTHIPTFFIVLVLGFFVFLKHPKDQASRLLLILNLSFALLIVINLILWTNINVRVITFAWPIAQLIYLVIPINSLYLFYVFLNKKTVPITFKVVWLALLAGAAAMLFSDSNILYFDVASCELVTADTIFHYQNIVFGLIISWLIFAGISRIKASFDTKEKKQITLFFVGILTFLMIFVSTWQLAGRLGYFAIEQYGLLGMAFFMAILAYLIVKFNAFKVNLIGTSALLISQGVIIASLLFVRDINYIYAIIAATLILFLILSIIVVRSVKKEIKQREEIERLALDLRRTNDNLEHANTRLKELDRQKTEFVSFATHQLRSPLTAMKGYSSLLLEGDYGEINMEARGAIEKIHESTNTLTVVVNDYLNISRIELGTMKYDFVSTDVRELISKIIGELQPNIDKAGLKLSFVCDARMKYMAKVDLDKFAQVIANMIDNAIKYTPFGTITISLTKDSTKGTLLIASKDTGIGMSAEVIPKLFAKFSRAENASKVNIRGTGLGLFVAKQITEAHKGRMWAESEGEGRGSQFYVEIPAEK